MAGITILYNGRQLSGVEKANVPDEEKLVTLSMANDAEAALEPLRVEIEKEGGEVTIDLKGPSMLHIATEGLSDKLKQKVMKALRPE